MGRAARVISARVVRAARHHGLRRARDRKGVDAGQRQTGSVDGRGAAARLVPSFVPPALVPSVVRHRIATMTRAARPVTAGRRSSNMYRGRFRQKYTPGGLQGDARCVRECVEAGPQAEARRRAAACVARLRPDGTSQHRRAQSAPHSACYAGLRHFLLAVLLLDPFFGGARPDFFTISSLRSRSSLSAFRTIGCFASGLCSGTYDSHCDAGARVSGRADIARGGGAPSAPSAPFV